MAKLISILLVAVVAVIAADTAAIESRAISFFWGPIKYTLDNSKPCPKEMNGQWVTIGNTTCRCRNVRLLFIQLFSFEKCRPASNRTSTTPSPIISTTPPVPTPADPTTETAAPVEPTTEGAAPVDPTTEAAAPVDPTTEAAASVDPTTESVVVEPTTEEAPVVVEPTTEAVPEP